ncbi:Porin D [compost metagenome]
MRTSVKNSLVIGILLPLSPNLFAENLFDNDKLTLTNKNFYFYRDFRNGASNPSGANKYLPISEREGYRNEWAQGLITNYESGYTDGSIQFGFDLYGLAGLKLSSTPYKTGTNLLKIDENGNAKDFYGELGGSIKVKHNNTILTYGNQFPNVPVIAVSTVRLLPSVATGITLKDKTIENLNFNLGYFYSMNPVDSTKNLNYFTTDYGVGIKGDSITYIGGTYQFKNSSITAYFADFKDIWKQSYLASTFNYKLNNDENFKSTLTIYNNTDSGEKIGGDIDTTLASAMIFYKYHNHALSVAYQQVLGDEPMDWVGFSTMGANITFANAAQFATFSEANEKSVQMRYDYDFSSWGVSGLSFMGRYIYGWDMDNQESTNKNYTTRHIYDPNVDNKHWERDLQFAYNIQSGFAKGLDIKFRQATHRATKGYRYNDIDELRIILEYPLSF